MAVKGMGAGLVLSILVLAGTVARDVDSGDVHSPPAKGKDGDRWKMKPAQASLFARLALKGIDREYPNKPGHVLNGPADVKGPRALHPAFFGCFDWHSSVHGHWML